MGTKSRATKLPPMNLLLPFLYTNPNEPTKYGTGARLRFHLTGEGTADDTESDTYGYKTYRAQRNSYRGPTIRYNQTLTKRRTLLCVRNYNNGDLLHRPKHCPRHHLHPALHHLQPFQAVDQAGGQAASRDHIAEAERGAGEAGVKRRKGGYYYFYNKWSRTVKTEL